MNKAMELALVLSATDNMSQTVQRIGNSVSKSVTDMMEKLNNAKAKYREDLGRGAMTAASGAGLVLSLQPAIAAFADLEDAATRAELAFSDSSGVDAYWSDIQAQAEKFGKNFQGSTRDYLEIAAAMKETGVEAKVMAGGGFEAAAKLKNILKLSNETAGALTGRLGNAFGVAGGDFNGFVDSLQKAKSAFGLDIEEYAYSVRQFSGALNPLGLTGGKAAGDITALSGMLWQAGIKGEMLGTSLRSILGKLPDISKKAAEAGLQMNFFDKKGQFAGVENMLAQFEKLNEFTPESKSKLMSKIFGDESSSAVAAMADNGVKGFEDAKARMAGKLDIDKVMAKLLGTISAKWEAFTGTVTSSLAAIGETLAPFVASALDFLNGAAGAIGDFAKAHPWLVRFAAGAATLAGGLLMLKGAFSAARGAFGLFSTSLQQGLAKLKGFKSSLKEALTPSGSGWTPQMQQMFGVSKAQYAWAGIKDRIKAAGGAAKQFFASPLLGMTALTMVVSNWDSIVELSSKASVQAKAFGVALGAAAMAVNPLLGGLIMAVSLASELTEMFNYLTKGKLGWAEKLKTNMQLFNYQTGERMSEQEYVADQVKKSDAMNALNVRESKNDADTRRAGAEERARLSYREAVAALNQERADIAAAPEKARNKAQQSVEQAQALADKMQKDLAKQQEENDKKAGKGLKTVADGFGNDVSGAMDKAFKPKRVINADLETLKRLAEIDKSNYASSAVAPDAVGEATRLAAAEGLQIPEKIERVKETRERYERYESRVAETSKSVTSETRTVQEVKGRTAAEQPPAARAVKEKAPAPAPARPEPLSGKVAQAPSAQAAEKKEMQPQWAEFIWSVDRAQAPVAQAAGKQETQPGWLDRFAGWRRSNPAQAGDKQEARSGWWDKFSGGQWKQSQPLAAEAASGPAAALAAGKADKQSERQAAGWWGAFPAMLSAKPDQAKAEPVPLEPARPEQPRTERNTAGNKTVTNNWYINVTTTAGQQAQDIARAIRGELRRAAEMG